MGGELFSSRLRFGRERTMSGSMIDAQRLRASFASALLLLATAACLPFPDPRNLTSSEAAMNNERMQSLIETLSPSFDGQLGYWVFDVREREVVVITDENADRMRIMTAVAEDRDLPPEQIRLLLEANFDRALDARYSVARGYVWSVFVHPLSPLDDEQFFDGVNQVVTLAENYGSSYSSTGLVFQGGQN